MPLNPLERSMSMSVQCIALQWELKPQRNCIVCLLVCLFVVGKVVKIYSLVYEKSNIKIGENKEQMIIYCVLVVERALA